MKDLKILIIEDEILIAEDLSDVIKSFGVKAIDMAHDKDSALLKIADFKPDLILLDIRMESEQTGIEIAEIVNEAHKIPFVFITAHSDMQMVQRILKTTPAGYITKPVKKSDVFANISLIAERIKYQKPRQINIKDGTTNVLIDYQDINYIESDGNYIVMHTINKKYLLRQNMDSIMAQLDDSAFYRVHRSYIVNVEKLTSYTRKELMLKDVYIPISKNAIDDFEKMINNKG
jgi:two-component system response regulator LytT